MKKEQTKQHNTMNTDTTKLSDVTKALKKAGFIKLDAEAALFGSEQGCTMCYFKYRGGLYINGANVGYTVAVFSGNTHTLTITHDWEMNTTKYEYV